MQYHLVQSLFGSRKTRLSVKYSTESFFVATSAPSPYIEPTFRKEVFETERPAVLLISAIGATGKTALSRALSSTLELPILDLGRHKPVGADTLTGLLTTSFDVADLSQLFAGLANATYGIIIDGIDEGRSKTNGAAFEAFLDDVARLANGSPGTTFLILGRTQVVEDCWVYLEDHGVKAGLLSISPFDTGQAKEYVDRVTKGPESSFATQYIQVRDQILHLLNTAFRGQGAAEQDFLSFIGYPPVLGAIAELLRENRNYAHLQGTLQATGGTEVEIQLVYRIVELLMKREREEKVIPNIVEGLLEQVSPADRAATRDIIFDPREQCYRLIAHCLGRPIALNRFKDAKPNEEYEERLSTWLPDHPFLAGREFRNAIFEAVSIALVLASSQVEWQEAAIEYARSRKQNYHVVYLLHIASGDDRVPINAVPVLLGSALEFRSRTAALEISVSSTGLPAEPVSVEIDILMSDGGKTKSFVFNCQSSCPQPQLQLGGRLASIFVNVDCEVALSGREVEFWAPVAIEASKIYIDAERLVLRSNGNEEEKRVLLGTERLASNVANLQCNGVDLILAVDSDDALAYPLAQYARARKPLPGAKDFVEKYRKFRKILVHFRSHSKGRLAKYRDKIEHERVAGNEVGRKVLDRLVADEILSLEGHMYFVAPEKFSEKLGVSYQDLRIGRTSDLLTTYLLSI